MNLKIIAQYNNGSSIRKVVGIGEDVFYAENNHGDTPYKIQVSLIPESAVKEIIEYVESESGSEYTAIEIMLNAVDQNYHMLAVDFRTEELVRQA